MATKTEGKHTAEFVVSESPGHISRDAVTVVVPADTTLQAGAVLGRLGNGKYASFDDANSDGTEDAAAVLYGGLTNSGEAPADMDGVVINFGAEVRKADLVWETGVDKDKAYADLAAVGVKAR